MSGRRDLVIWLAVSLSIATNACKSESSHKTAPSATPSVAAPVASAAPPKPWFVGAWSGPYAAKQFAIEPAPGAIKEWSKDDGSKASGSGKLTLRIDDSGIVDGEADGPLGPLQANGQVEGETVRVSLRASGEGTAQNAAFFGFLLGTRSGETIKGNLQASSGDSVTVRQASVELQKQPQ